MSCNFSVLLTLFLLFLYSSSIIIDANSFLPFFPMQMSSYKRATFEEEEAAENPADGGMSPDSVEVSLSSLVDVWGSEVNENGEATQCQCVYYRTRVNSTCTPIMGQFFIFPTNG